PRVAAGLLSWPAWRALADADAVFVRDDGHEQSEALREARIRWRRPTSVTPAELARELVDAARGSQVVFVGSADSDPGLTDALADELSRIALHDEPPMVEVLVGS